MERERRLATCAHHGCVDRPNNLAAARAVLKEWPEIECMEIDFCEYQGQFLSAHDHAPHKLAQGSSLAEWVHWLCVEKRRTLYVDLKATYGLTSWLWPQCKFDLASLLGELERLRRRYAEDARRPTDIARRIWIASQDRDVAQQLLQYCQGDYGHWIVIADVPYMGAYVRRHTLGNCLWPQLNSQVVCEMTQYGYPHIYVAIDCSFVGLDSLQQFVAQAGIKTGTTLVLYAFPRSQAPVRVEGYDVLMMYDYHENTRPPVKRGKK